MSNGSFYDNLKSEFRDYLDPKLLEHLNPENGPKRILSLNGGGVRGLITLGALERVEYLLQEHYQNDEYRLSDHFDLIAGTSTGSIIAVGLSLGWSIEKIKTLYFELCPKLFKPNRRLGIMKARFDVKHLEGMLTQHLVHPDERGPITLGSDQLKTGLLICAKRMDTDSAWLMNNHPNGQFYDAEPHQTFLPNKEYTLKTLVRASTAAPTFLDPQTILIGGGQTQYDMEVGIFVDGAISGHNSPALAAYQLATLPSYKFNWRTGEENLSMLSLGTGHFRNRCKVDDFSNDRAVQQGIASLQGLIAESQKGTLTTMQALSNSRSPVSINSEINGLEGELMTPEPMLRFQHHDAKLELDEVRARLNLESENVGKVQKVVDSLRDMANGRKKNLEALYHIGRTLQEEITLEDIL